MTKDQTSEIKKAEILAEALPYMQRYERKCVVVKYGGHAMGDSDLTKAFVQDVVLLKQAGVNVIVVHGGGPQIGQLLDKLSIESEFKEGLRVTDKKTIEVVEMVLSGLINKEIVSLINNEGGRAVGLSGKDGNLLQANKLERKVIDPQTNEERMIDLGLVGEPQKVDRSLLDLIIFSQFIPVIAPVAADADGMTYNINSDTFAGAIAAAMNAERFLLLTDVDGVLDAKGQLVTEIDASKALEMIKSGAISGGMIPKIETALKAVEEGVGGVVITNGRTSHSVILELFTEGGSGTMIRHTET